MSLTPGVGYTPLFRLRSSALRFFLVCSSLLADSGEECRPCLFAHDEGGAGGVFAVADGDDVGEVGGDFYAVAAGGPAVA